MATKAGVGGSTRSRRRRWALASVAALVLGAGMTTTGLSAPSASRTPTAPRAVTGSPSEFQFCPVNFTNPSVQASGLECGHSETTGGQITLGNSSAPLTNNPDTVDLAGYRPLSRPTTQQLAVVLPTNGALFGGPAQPVPGGLLGLMCPSGIPAVSALCLEATTNPDLAGVTASLVLAAPPIPASDLDPTSTTYWFDPLAAISGFDNVAVMRLPVKIQLHNILLGNNCYVGTDANPIVLALMRLPSPNETVHAVGFVIVVSAVVLGDSTFAVPGATGCGPLGVADPAINLKEGWPSPSGKNSVVIDANAEVAPAGIVKRGF